MVGYDRLVGEQAYWQLRELYRAVRLYVNCFQPSMKIQSKHRQEGKIRRVYDIARTPLQRLILSGSVSEQRQQDLREAVQSLDPLRLLQHLERLQQALWSQSSLCQTVPPASLLSFCVHHGRPGPSTSDEQRPAPASMLQRVHEHPSGRAGLLEWPRTSKDPFEGQWELILSLVLMHPEWSGNSVFQELQRLFPGRYRASQEQTLLTGLRKIRARLLALMQEPWPEEVIRAPIRPGIEAFVDQPETELPIMLPPAASPLQTSPAPRGLDQPMREEGLDVSSISGATAVPKQVTPIGDGGNQRSLQVQPLTMTIAGVIQEYLQEQMTQGHRPKTIEWHQTALNLFRQYLEDERHRSLFCQITEADVRSWVTFLQDTPSSKETPRSPWTIATYARSARALCFWGVRSGYLERSPFVKGIIPKMKRKTVSVIETNEFERLLLACRTGGERPPSLDRVAMRNRAILWVLLDTGMLVSELCGLRLGDVDRERNALRIQRPGGSGRWVRLSTNGWYQVLSYVEQYRPTREKVEAGGTEDDHLFLSEWYQPLTGNSITLLFHRIKQRAGIPNKPVTPSVLRDTFAVRFLQEGGGSWKL